MKWTLLTLEPLAFQCRSRTEFARRHPNAYSFAYRWGLLETICSHVEVKRNGYWTFERVLAERRKYTTLTEFKRGCGAAYNKAQIKKWLDLVK